MSSFKELKHLFPLVEAQTEAGLYVVKRCAQYLKKMADAYVDAAKSFEKITKHEEGKMRDMQADGMMRHVAAVIEIQDLFAERSKRQRELGEKVQQTVVQPMQEWEKKARKKRDKIISREHKLASHLAKSRASLLKERGKCHDTFQELLALKEQVDAEEQRDGANSGKFEKLRKKLTSNRESARKKFGKYEEQREALKQEADKYENEYLPALMEELEELETDRLQTLDVYLQHFAQLHSAFAAPMERSDKFEEMVKGLTPKGDLGAYMAMKVSMFNENPVMAPIEMDIPCSADIVMTDQWVNGGPHPAAQADEAKPAPPSGNPPPPAGSPPKPAAAAAAPKPAAPAGAPPPAAAAPKPAAPAAPKYVLYVRALYPFPGEESDDLALNAGDVIGVLNNTDSAGNPSDWWIGELNGKKGRFPSNYVEECPPPASAAAAAPPAAAPAAAPPAAAPAAAPPAASAGPPGSYPVQAIYDFSYVPVGDPAVDDLGYISFSAGAVIHVIQEYDADWWFGDLNGQTGYFPSNVVQKM